MNLIKLRLRLRVATIKNASWGAEGFWLAELRVRQLKIGCKSCFVVSADFQTKLGRNFAAIKKTKTNFRKKVEP